jgi:hypothetical protein
MTRGGLPPSVGQILQGDPGPTLSFGTAASMTGGGLPPSVGQILQGDPGPTLSFGTAASMTGGGLPPSVGQILQGDPWFVSSIPNSDHRARMSEAHRPRRTTGRLQRGGVRGAEIRICSHSLRVFSLPDLRILTTSGCSHYQRLEFSLPVAVLTTRASNSQYQWMFSLPEL